MSLITKPLPVPPTQAFRIRTHRSRRDQWRYPIEQIGRLGQRLASRPEVKTAIAALDSAWDAYWTAVDDLDESAVDARDAAIDRADQAWTRLKSAYDRAKALMK